MKSPSSRTASVRIWFVGSVVVVTLLALAWFFVLGPSASRLGTLTIEASGPEMQVVIAGQGKVHRQPGGGEVSLPPGRYEVWCSVAGRVGESVWVEVPAGGNTMARPALPKPTRAFLVLGRDGETEQDFASLAEAIAFAGEGDTIEVHGNGPFLNPSLRIDRALIIRAAPGYRPVLRWRPEATGYLMHTTAALTLEGLELDGRPGGQGNARHLLVTDGPELNLAWCRLMQEVPEPLVCRSKVCRVTNCAILGTTHSGLSWAASPGGRLRVAGSILTHLGLSMPAKPPADMVVDLHRCTIAGNWSGVIMGYPTAVAEKGTPVRFTASACVFRPAHNVFVINHYGDKEWTAEEANSAVSRLITWTDRGNVMGRGLNLVSTRKAFKEAPQYPSTKTMEEWLKLRGQTKADARLAQVRFADDTISEPPDRPSATAGRRLSAYRLVDPANQNVGADVDRIGPGPGYDRWRQTPAYKAWQDGKGSLAEWLADETVSKLRSLVAADRADEAETLLSEKLKEQPNQPELIHALATAWHQRVRSLRQQKKPQLTAQAERRARDYYERSLRLRPEDTEYQADLAELLLPTIDDIDWQTLNVTEAISAEGATLTPEKDGSIFVSGTNPERDSYSVTGTTKLKSITALRLDSIPDPRLRGGAGRSGNNHFAISEVRFLIQKAGDKPHPIAIHGAWSDHANGNEVIENTTDGNQQTFWNTWPHIKVPHTAVFLTDRAVNNPAGAKWTVELDFLTEATWTHHTLGRFRLSATSQKSPLLGSHLRQALLRNELSASMALAGAEYLRGNGKAALEALNKGSATSPEDAFLAALIHEDAGQTQEAKKRYEQGIEALKRQERNAGLNALAREAMLSVAKLPGKKAADLLQTLNRQGLETSLTARIKAKPEQTNLYILRSDFYGRQGKWKEAAADLKEVRRLDPKRYWEWYRYTILLAYFADEKEYQKQRQEALKLFAETKDPYLAERVAKVCLLLPGTAEEYRQAERLARTAVKEGGKLDARLYFRFAVALADFRAKQFAAAAKEAQSILEDKPSPTLRVKTRVLLALALHQQGETEEAAKEFKEVTAIIDRGMVAEESWHDWVICLILRREAERLIGKDAG